MVLLSAALNILAQGGDSTEHPGLISQERSKALLGNWTTVVDNIGQADLVRSEGPTVFQSITDPKRWYLFLDEYGTPECP